MNKISIEQLLNPIHQEFPHEKLKEINDKLLTLCSKLPAENEKLEEDRSELEKILPSLNTLLKEKPSSKDQKMIQKIHQLFSVFSALLNEVSELRSKKNKLFPSKQMSRLSNETTLGDKGKNRTVFNVVTQDTLEYTKNSRKTYRGHRLPKYVTNSLESWFKRNIKHPYLNNSSIKQLITETKLSGPQIKNWVSNRRRKEKSLTVSFDVSELVRKNKRDREDSSG